MMQIVELISTVVAPVALLTAMLGYIGWIRSRAFYGYFGLSASLVSFSPQDYVLRSAEVSFGAVLFLALAGVMLLGFDQLLTRIVKATPRWENGLRRVLTGVGAVLVFVSLGGATTEASTEIVPPMGGAMLLGLGAVILIRFGMESAGRVRLLPPAAVGLAVVMLVLAGFWATTSYAQNLGMGAAEAIDRDPRNLPVITVYSRRPLDLPGKNVIAYRILDQDRQWTYRYTGSRLLVYSNRRWFLISEPASPTYRPSVTILPDMDTIRVETTVPR